MILPYLILIQGMPGAPGMKMYSREDLMKQNFGAENENDEDESDDEDDGFPSNLVQLSISFIVIENLFSKDFVDLIKMFLKNSSLE